MGSEQGRQEGLERLSGWLDVVETHLVREIAARTGEAPGAVSGRAGGWPGAHEPAPAQLRCAGINLPLLLPAVVLLLPVVVLLLPAVVLLLPAVVVLPTCRCRCRCC